MAQDWKAVLENARAELADLEIQREAIEKRIGQIKRTILATEPLAIEATRLQGIGSDAAMAEIQAMGITDACREVLRSAGKSLAPLEVRDALVARGVDLSAQSNAMASIHAVLKRLHEQGQVRVVTSKDGGTLYKWRRKHVLLPRVRVATTVISPWAATPARPAPVPRVLDIEPIPAPTPSGVKGK